MVVVVVLVVISLLYSHGRITSLLPSTSPAFFLLLPHFLPPFHILLTPFRCSSLIHHFFSSSIFILQLLPHSRSVLPTLLVFLFCQPVLFILPSFCLSMFSRLILLLHSPSVLSFLSPSFSILPSKASLSSSASMQGKQSLYRRGQGWSTSRRPFITTIPYIWP